MKLYVGKASVQFGDAGGGNYGTAVLKTLDGVDIDYKPTFNAIHVEQNDHPILQLKKQEETTITLNFQEADLVHMNLAISGSTNSGTVLKVGSIQPVTRSIKIVGTAVDPATGLVGGSGNTKTTVFPFVIAMGDVKESYKKGELTIVPVSFSVLADTSVTDGSGDAFTQTES